LKGSWHSGKPLHEEADGRAVKAANKESDDEDIRYPGGQSQKVVSTGLMTHARQNHTLGAQQLRNATKRTKRRWHGV